METWKKFAILFGILIPIIIVLTLLAVNFNGWGKQVSGISGPFTNGLYQLGLKLPQFMMQNGYTMIISYLLIFIGFPLLVAWAVWHWDVGYKFSNATTSNNKLEGYNAQREPEDAETLNTIKKGA
jgi:hypothetical protein